MKEVFALEFDNFPNGVGKVKIVEPDHLVDRVVIEIDGKEIVLLETVRDQWGVWVSSDGGVSVGQEDGTRSFLEALQKVIAEIRNRNEPQNVHNS